MDKWRSGREDMFGGRRTPWETRKDWGGEEEKKSVLGLGSAAVKWSSSSITRKKEIRLYTGLVLQYASVMGGMGIDDHWEEWWWVEWGRRRGPIQMERFEWLADMLWYVEIGTWRRGRKDCYIVTGVGVALVGSKAWGVQRGRWMGRFNFEGTQWNDFVS